VRRTEAISVRRHLTALLVLAGVVACTETLTDPIVESDDPLDGPLLYNPDWTAASHEKVAPNYSVVFAQDSVARLDIRMTSTQWASIQSNVSQLWGFEFGAGQTSGVRIPDEDPDYVDVTVAFGGMRWDHVGFRLKGHQSLLFSWWSGTQKLPFRLHFDWFEDDFPGIPDQRMYGFRELSMAPGFSDGSLIKERLSSELFRMAGVPAARTAFYRVYIDFGNGPAYAGVYTMVEVIDDTMVESQFGEDAGNIYKPESAWRDFSEDDFEKKNNSGEADFSDVRDALGILKSSTRLTDPLGWRTALEATFDVDHFLGWLAVGNTIVNKDSYGSRPRNYYLYHHSSRGLVWIPWDHNLSLDGSPGISNSPGRGTDGLTLTMDEVEADFPLIRYVMDDPVYAAQYRGHLTSFVEDVFTPSRVDALVDEFEALITPWVIGTAGEQAGFTQLTNPGIFPSALADLKTHLESRRALVLQFLSGSH